MKIAVDKVAEVIPQVERFVRRRVGEFERLGREGRTQYDFRPFIDIDYEAGLFSELCFCILTANSSASMGIKIQAELGDEGFMKLGYAELAKSIRKYGHRFPEQRAERIVEVRERWESIRELIESDREATEVRRLLADPKSEFKIKGFGYKEASHFLRNIGAKDIAIIDRHVYRFLTENGLFPEVKTLTPRRYIQAEETLAKVCERLGITQAELDLYIFYIKTKKVLK
ncbi:N-glycosylase/DNA lyase [Hydrogenivirga sp.]